MLCLGGASSSGVCSGWSDTASSLVYEHHLINQASHTAVIYITEQENPGEGLDLDLTICSNAAFESCKASIDGKSK